MTGIPPPPAEPYIIPVTWKDRLAPSWPAALGLAMMVIGASRCLGGVILLAGRYRQSGQYLAILSGLIYYLPSVLLCAAGLHVLTRHSYARVFCLIYAWGAIAVSAAGLAPYLLMGRLGMASTLPLTVSIIGSLLVPMTVMLWVGWAPVHSEMQCWSRGEQFDLNKPVKAVGWNLPMAWVLIALGLTELLTVVLRVYYMISMSGSVSRSAALYDVLFSCIVPLCLIASGYMLLRRDRGGATLLLIVAIGMVIILSVAGYDLVKERLQSFHSMESGWHDGAALAMLAGPAILTLWWFLRPGVRREMAK